MARVGSPIPLYVDGRPLPAGDAVAAAVAHVQALAEGRLGQAPALTVLTVPPSWGEHRWADLADALCAAGGPPVALASAAVAVVAHHVAAGDLPAEAAVAVCDIGARTVDTAVVGPTSDAPAEHLGVPPDPFPWGGDDIDDVVIERVLHAGNARAEAAELSPSAAGRLRERCMAAKEALSSETAVGVDLELPALAGPVRLTREELDELLEEPVADVIDVVSEALTAAGLTPDDLAAVLLAGGTARVPLIAERLSAALHRPLVVANEPAWTAALGGARIAADAAGEQPVDPGRDEVRLPRAGRGRRRGAAPAPERRGLQRALLVAALLVILLTVPSVLFAALGLDHAGSVVGQSVAEAEQPQTSPAGQSARGAGDRLRPVADRAAGGEGTTASGGGSDGGSAAVGTRSSSTSAGPSGSSAPLPASAPAPTSTTTPAPSVGTPTGGSTPPTTTGSGPTPTDPSTQTPSDTPTGTPTDASTGTPSDPPTDTAGPPTTETPPEPPPTTQVVVGDPGATGGPSTSEAP
jgi:molecular chaperone DnaK